MSTTTAPVEQVQQRRLSALLELARASWSPPREGPADLEPLLEAAVGGPAGGQGRLLAARFRALAPCAASTRFSRAERQHLLDGSAEAPLAVDPSRLAAMGEARVIPAPAGGSSRLEAPVRMGGQLVGVVRHEREGDPPRAFDSEDGFLAASLADIVALALEAGRAAGARSGWPTSPCTIRSPTCPTAACSSSGWNGRCEASSAAAGSWPSCPSRWMGFPRRVRAADGRPGTRWSRPRPRPWSACCGPRTPPPAWRTTASAS